MIATSFNMTFMKHLTSHQTSSFYFKQDDYVLLEEREKMIAALRTSNNVLILPFFLRKSCIQYDRGILLLFVCNLFY